MLQKPQHFNPPESPFPWCTEWLPSSWFPKSVHRSYRPLQSHQLRLVPALGLQDQHLVCTVAGSTQHLGWGHQSLQGHLSTGEPCSIQFEMFHVLGVNWDLTDEKGQLSEF